MQKRTLRAIDLDERVSGERVLGHRGGRTYLRDRRAVLRDEMQEQKGLPDTERLGGQGRIGRNSTSMECSVDPSHMFRVQPRAGKGACAELGGKQRYG